MVDKIDEITAKYGLKINTDMGDCDEIILTQKYGEIFSGDFTGGGYMYDDGTFQLDAVFNGVNLQIRRCMRGYFDTVYLNLGTTKNFEDYSYKTKSGVTVNISTGKDGMGNNRWIIAADLENSFVTLNIMPHDYDGNTKEYTKEDIQNLLDQIDFNKL